MHPAVWVLDHLAQHGWRTVDLLAFTRSSTLVLATRGGDEPVVVKAGFGSNHVLAAMDESDRAAAYGFYWYQQMTPTERGLAREDFRHERDLALDCLGAAHIVPAIAEGQCPEFDWYAMPHYADGNLRTLMSDDRAPIQRYLTILADAADGLDELHRRGIVHRDVYQENVLIDAGRGMITDLGAARRLDTPRGPRSRGPEVHWPPEYSLGYATATPAADVFSLAVLAYRVLFGDLPRLCGPRHRPDLPTALSEHVTAALACDPNDRPSMPQLRAALRAAATTST
ncbi:protein kinase domain-containing protein [Nocardia gipuzkoensis]|uniref:protein kinase domain-containing protein n=1 Tax=Nocardia gipuzkoensis TaxID=2749991 RepID=UPI0015EED799|nr:protein kinase [Nocardia gipuzkoensis]